MRPQNVMARACLSRRHGFAELLGAFCAIWGLQPTHGGWESPAAAHGLDQRCRLFSITRGDCYAGEFLARAAEATH